MYKGSEQWSSNATESPGGLAKIQNAGPWPPEFPVQWSGPRICISKIFLGDADAVGTSLCKSLTLKQKPAKHERKERDDDDKNEEENDYVIVSAANCSDYSESVLCKALGLYLLILATNHRCYYFHFIDEKTKE